MSSCVNLDKCIERLKNCELLTENQVKSICYSLKQVLITTSNVCQVRTPVTVVGDIHGQFYDLLELFRIGGDCPDTNYLFLGDYVDRGHFSIQTISLLVCLKLRWPDRITLLRGNHESRQVTQVYGFYSECVRKYGSPVVWHAFVDLFDYLNTAAVIDNRIFCVHGGLSPSVQRIDQIRVLNRFQEVPHEGPLADLMWSDPDPDNDGFMPSQRGAGFTFGREVVAQFLKLNSVEHIVRSHQLCMDGYQVVFQGALSTVWSAPNYCYRCGNVAAVMEVAEDCKRRYNTFFAAPETERSPPDVGPNKETPDYFT